MIYKKNRPLYRISGLISAVVAWLFTTIAFAQLPATPVGVDAVRTEPMSQTIPVLGRFVSPQSGPVAARTGGPVARLTVDIGDHVERGDVIAELDQDRLRISLAQQDAELKALEASRKSAEARERYAEQELLRIEKLRGTAAFSRSNYDQKLQELEVGRSSRELAEARIARGKVDREMAALELHDAIIRAPYSGVVTLRHTSEGAWLRVGDPVVTLIDDVDLEIEADVLAERLSGVQPGVKIQARLDNGTLFETAVRAIIPDENPAARTRPVRFKLDLSSLDAGLAINQPVTLSLPASGVAEVISVAKDAVIRRGTNAIVFVVQDGAAQPRPVQLGEAIGDRFQVLGGLAPGDLVVVRGNERLRPGQAVRYPGQPSQDAKPAAEQG